MDYMLSLFLFTLYSSVHLWVIQSTYSIGWFWASLIYTKYTKVFLYLHIIHTGVLSVIRGSWQVPSGQAECSFGSGWCQNSGVLGVWWDLGTSLLIGSFKVHWLLSLASGTGSLRPQLRLVDSVESFKTFYFNKPSVEQFCCCCYFFYFYFLFTLYCLFWYFTFCLF